MHKEYVRGVRAAAEIAALFDKLSVHPWLVSDCIEAKLNLRKKTKIRKNPKESSGWLEGFALALAEMNRRFDQPTMVKEVMRDAGVTIAMLRKAGVSKYDVDELDFRKRKLP